jgi:adenylyltransferase/sulfurtransferase
MPVVSPLAPHISVSNTELQYSQRVTGRRRYSRLERYAPLSATLPRWQQSTCAVVGLGGLGGGLAMQLARFGVQRIVLIDRDIVAVENLGHQSLFTTQHAADGLPKAVAAKEVLAGLNPYIEPVAIADELTRHNIRELLKGVDFIFDGLDNYYTRLLLNDYSRTSGTPYFYAGLVIGELSARAVISGVSGCLRCLIDRPPAVGEVPTCASEGVFPPLLGLANALQIDAANRYLAGEFTVADDILYSLKLPDWTIHKLALHGPRGDCPACSGQYEYLEGTLDTFIASACAPDRAEAEVGGIDLKKAGDQISASGEFEMHRNPYCVVAEQGGLRYTLFSSGKVVQEGDRDPAQLRRFLATYLSM